MLRPGVYVTRTIPERALKVLQEVANVKMRREEMPPSKEEIIQQISDVDGLLCLLTDKIDSEVIEAGKNLKVISNYAVGFDNIDVETATRHGIYVTNTPGVLTETTADFTWALLMAVARRIVEADKYVRQGFWKVAWAPMMMLGKDIYGKTLGILGLGRIGAAVARRARGFNTRILYHSRTRKVDLEKELGVEYADFETLLRDSDFVTIHLPLTNETFHMIGERELSLMKKTAYLVNTSRGSVVDQKALYYALKEGKIAGAALDVFEQEPVNLSDPLLQLENVVIAPHIASASVETRTKMGVMAAENLVSVLKGRIPPNLVNADVLRIRPLEQN